MSVDYMHVINLVPILLVIAIIFKIGSDILELKSTIFYKDATISSLKNIINKYKETFVYPDMPEDSVFVMVPDWNNTPPEKFAITLYKHFGGAKTYKIILLLNKGLQYPDWFFKRVLESLHVEYGEDACSKRIKVLDVTGRSNSVKEDLELLIKRF